MPDEGAQRTIRPADHADYTFVVGDLDPEVLMVTGFSGAEELSRLFHFRVELCSNDPEIDPADLINKACALEIAGPSGSRYVNAIVRRFERLGESATKSYYAAEIVPKHWLLSRRVKSRIFQEESCPDMSVPGVIEKVLTDAGYGADDYRMALSGSYAPREYIVQFREAELDFIQRLMEAEGICYFFEHTADGHKMVFGDSPVAHAETPNVSEYSFREKTGLVTEQDQEYVYGLCDQHEVHIGSVGLDEYNFKQPAVALASDQKADKFTSLEYIDWGKFAEKEEGQRYAQVRKEEFESSKQVQLMQTCARGLMPGYKFTLAEHPAQRLNREYLVTSISHRASQPQAGQQDSDGSRGIEYEAQITTIPADVPYRPRRVTPKPTIDGIQTAVVVGPEGEEVHTDEYGRVRLHFFWEREGVQSRWVRVNQSAAGGGYGSIFLPRVGQEVIVAFEHGDPDLPMVIGRCYNNDQMPPYSLPDNKTRSCIKTNSMTGGGTNEIRFEDKKGEEQMMIFAQKDFHERCENDNIVKVGANRNIAIGADDVLSVGADQHVAIGADKLEDIGGNFRIATNGNKLETIGGSSTQTIGANAGITVGSALVIQAGSGLTIKCGPSFISLSSSGISISGPKVNINSGGSAGTHTKVNISKQLKKPKEADKGVPGADVKYARKDTYDSTALETTSISSGSEDGGEPGETSWIEVALRDSEGNPCAFERYRLLLPNGRSVNGFLDEQGQAHYVGPPGEYDVEFPDLDREAWDRS